jgi:hypothetical protein
MKTVPLSAVFAVAHGNKFDLNKMSKCAPSDDAVAFIGRTGEHNGVVAFVEKLEGKEPYGSGLITVALGGSALSSFVQSRPFYTAQNIDVLKPRSAMSLDVKLYYCLCIEANQFRYSTFGREANRTLRNVLVPDPNDIPPWADGATAQAIENLRFDLASIAGNSMEAAVSSSHVRPGPKPEVLKIDMDWKDAVRVAMQKKKPPEGWPK